MTSTNPAAESDAPEKPLAEILAEIASAGLDARGFRTLAMATGVGVGARDELRALLNDWSPVEAAGAGRDVNEVLRGFCLLTTGDIEGANAALSAQTSNPWGAYHLARSCMERGRPSEAVKITAAARKKHADFVPGLRLLVEARCRIGEVDEAEKDLGELEKIAPDTADYHCARAAFLDRSGEYGDAIDAYRAAVEKEPENTEAIFRLAYLLDIHGSDADEANDAALAAYERCVHSGPLHVNAVLNLGLIYEDRERYHDAIKCYESVLRSYPNHQRAALYLDDARASTTMFYDREQEKKADRQSQVLKIPVTDFELSVRSRNCLQKMEIRTLGDLIMKTEQELLSYKNFGETSLEEIKEMLTQKNLSLGQGLDDGGGEGGHGRNPLEATADQGVLDKPVEELDLTVRSRRCMERLGIRTVRDLINKTEMELMSAKNFGMTSLNEIKLKLAELGLSLRS